MVSFQPSVNWRNRWFMADVAKAGAAIAGIVPKEKDSPIHDLTDDHYESFCEIPDAE